MKTPEKVFDGLMVLEYQSGKKKALSILVKRHHLRLCRHSYRYTEDIEAAKDVVQEAWKTIMGKLHTLKDPNSFGSWATMIVTRKSLDHIDRVKRNRKRNENYGQENWENDDTDGNATDIKRLQSAIKELSHDQQMVLRLFYTESYSLKEIGEILEISVGTAKSRLFHAREKLKKILKD